jgi:hypothetical protein
MDVVDDNKCFGAFFPETAMFYLKIKLILSVRKVNIMVTMIIIQVFNQIPEEKSGYWIEVCRVADGQTGVNNFFYVLLLLHFSRDFNQTLT